MSSSPRNKVRAEVNKWLARHRATNLAIQPITWRAVDTIQKGVPVGPAVAAALKTIPPEKTEDVPHSGIFFPGVEYLFIDNKHPDVGRVNNNKCIGVQIVLDEREPADPGTGAMWELQFLPKAIFVRPDGAGQLQLLTMHPFEQGTIPIEPTNTKAMTVSYGDKAQHSVVFKRRNFPLTLAYALTDYYAQGMSFKATERWLLYLNIPSTGGGLKRSSILVMLSRYTSWDSVMLWRPLWKEGDAAGRLKVVRAFLDAAKIDDTLKRDMVRLVHLAAETKKQEELLSKTNMIE